MSILNDELFRRLIDAARLAPSADNTQPWAFQRSGATIEALIRRERMLPTDVENMFSWIAMGAACENIALAATRDRLLVDVRVESGVPPTADGEQPAALLNFSKGGTEHPLAAYIDKRHTNRKPYRTDPLPPAAVKGLEEFAGPDVRVHWLHTAEERSRFSDTMAECDRTRLEHFPFHQELFSILRLSDQEAEATRDGLHFRSLEIPESELPKLRRLADFDACKRENEAGFSKALARGGADLTKQAAAVGLISIPKPAPSPWFEAGRAFERLWLKATEQGLALQPIGGLPQFLTRLSLAAETFLPEHRDRMVRLQETLGSLFPDLGGRSIGVLFRIGRPSAAAGGRSYRLGVEQLIKGA